MQWHTHFKEDRIQKLFGSITWVIVLANYRRNPRILSGILDGIDGATKEFSNLANLFAIILGLEMLRRQPVIVKNENGIVSQ